LPMAFKTQKYQEGNMKPVHFLASAGVLLTLAAT